jgi:hypothetical protein
MCTNGSALLGTLPSHDYGGYADDDHLQHGGDGLTDDELAEMATREMLVYLDDAVACHQVRANTPSTIDAFLGYMRREGYARARAGYDPMPEVVSGAAPWKHCPDGGDAPATASDSGGTRKEAP